MASTSGRLLDWQFQCSVCLEVFTDPVSTPCGHTFCRACLSGCWDGKDEQQCPLCMKRFGDPLDLSVNVVLAQITQDYKRRRLEPLEPCAESPKKPTCDICTGGNNSKVVKTCRSCHTSLCADHVETHPAEHELVHLMDHFKQKLCEKHDRLLELFCSTDQACICTLCAEGNHVTHSTVPIEREWTLRQAQLKSAVLEVKQDILDRQKKVQDIKQRVELSRRDSEKKQEEGLQVLAILLSYIEKCKAEFVEVIKERQRAAESRAESLMEELEQEIAELKKRNTTLKQLLSSQDRAHILQSFPSQHTPFISKDWAKVMVHIDPCLGTGGRVFAPLEQDITKKLRELTGAEFEKIQQNADDVTLDPDTANDYLQVSNDEKQVHFSNYRQFHFDNQRRFAKSIFVLGKETFSSGRHYWEVQVKGKTNWWLGVVLESIDRKVDVTVTPENGVWMLRLTEGKILNGLTHPVVQLSPISVPETVGVYVDYEEGRVSFYDVEDKSHLFSFTGITFTEGLYPMFSPGVKKTDKDPLIISPVTKPG